MRHLRFLPFILLILATVTNAMQRPELDIVEINPRGTPDAAVIWLHGLGADGHDFEPIVTQLGLGDDFAVRFVFPHAPRLAVTINGGAVMRAWYDIIEQSIDRQVDHNGIKASIKLVNELIAREIERGIAANKIILAGFSQGGLIALEAGLRHQPKLAGVIALSTYLANRESIPSGSSPIFMSHGTMDPIVPIALGKQAYNTLREKGYRVKWQSYPMEHSVCMEEIIAIGQWIKARLK
jgi:phospholipase/carboxylesterase